MKGYLFVATSEHDCSGRYCSKDHKIKIGERAVKATVKKSNLHESFNATSYYHEECFPQGKGGK
jgi:hypothetical protein